jgi:hypothetical protein
MWLLNLHKMYDTHLNMISENYINFVAVISLGEKTDFILCDDKLKTSTKKLQVYFRTPYQVHLHETSRGFHSWFFKKLSVIHPTQSRIL